jgi:hypothetical protein
MGEERYKRKKSIYNTIIESTALYMGARSGDLKKRNMALEMDFWRRSSNNI